MKSKLTKQVKGFTIIEVMIVLAIAGLILAVVLLAVPALQRNQRNNARQSDATHWAGLVNDYVSNHGGAMPPSGSFSGAGDTFSQLATLTVVTAAGSGTTTSAVMEPNTSCTNGAVGGFGAQKGSFAIVWQYETSGSTATTCIAS